MMKRYRILTPVPNHTEVIGTVAFSQGVAECEAEQLAAPLMYFRAQGYTILEQDEAGEWVPEGPLPPRSKGVDPVAALQAENEALRAQLAALAGPAPAAKPTRNASTETWRTWAVEHGGLDAAEASELSRDQLVERFADTEEPKP